MAKKKKDLGGEQVPLIDVLPENAKEILAAGRYRKSLHEREVEQNFYSVYRDMDCAIFKVLEVRPLRC